MKTVFDDLAALLEQGEEAVMAVIYASAGSAPRTAGARMLVQRDGAISGTIGGGLLEARTQLTAADVFEQQMPLIEEFSLTGADASQMEMICGGEVAVLLEYVDPRAPRQLAFYRAVAQAGSGRHRAWLVTGLPAGPETAEVPHALLTPLPGSEPRYELAASTDDDFELDLAEITTFLQRPQAAASRYPLLYRQGQQRLLIEPLGAPGTVILYGGGHVSQKLAPLLEPLGFRIVVVDDRPEFASADRFPLAQDFVVPGSFAKAVEQSQVDADSYLVIVTRGHLHDKTVLAQALRTPAAYIGMIGSVRKRNAIYDELLKEGFTRADLERVHSPIGLEIGAESPEEIAVSIAAQLIQVRAGRA